MKDLAGKVAVVTGGASGIGLATARALAADGMKLVLADIEEPALEKAAAELSEAGHTVVPVVCDVSDADAVDALARRTLDELGAVHVVHLNAGVATGGLSWQLSRRDWEWVLGVNLWGVIHGIRSFVPHLIAQGEGHVVNTASMAGLTASGFMAPYTVSKHGVVALSETLYKELQTVGGNVGVSVLCPGWVNTGIGDSSRNRPASMRDEDAHDLGDLGGGMIRQVLQTGLEPAAVAACVVDAIKEPRFYVLTHPWHDMIRTRMDDILEGRNPTSSPLPS